MCRRVLVRAKMETAMEGIRKNISNNKGLKFEFERIFEKTLIGHVGTKTLIGKNWVHSLESGIKEFWAERRNVLKAV